MKLDGKTVIVTGGARGLGRAYALRLAGLGADIVIADVDLRGAARFNEQLTAASVGEEVRPLGRKSIEVQADLTERSNALELVKRAIAEFGRIDILINNAGGAITRIDRSLPSISPDEDTELTFDINFFSTVYCCQAVIPTMKQRRAGVVINTASVAARSILSEGKYCMYGASKAAVVHYTRCLAAELGPFGIRVNCIAPGTTLTARIKAWASERGYGGEAEAQAIPLRRLGKPEDCARVVEFLATDLSGYVTGQCISVCGGSTLIPA